jgi:hypothetical protein
MQVRQYSVQLNKGNTLLMVYYDIIANYIDAKPISRSHVDQQMIVAYQKLWEQTN